MAVAQGAGCVSTLIQLEPLLGTAIVLNLAYLNLPKFAYIATVRSMLRRRIRLLDREVVAQIHRAQWFIQLRALTEVETLDMGRFWPRTLWVRAPSLWGVLYNVFFNWRIARIVSVAATVYALTYLAIAVGLHAHVMHDFECSFNEGTIGGEYNLVLAAVIWPLLAVCLGQYIVWRSNRFMTYSLTGIKDKAVAAATTKLTALDEWLDSLDDPDA